MASETSVLGGADHETGPAGARASLVRVVGGGWTPDLALLGLLLALTAVFGRSFSHLGLHRLHLYVTEPALLAVAVAAVLRCGARGTWTRLRVVPRWPLLAFWIAGGVATIRGLHSYGLSRVADDVGLAEYSVLVALVALIVDSRRRAYLFFRLLLAASVVGGFAYAVTRLGWPTGGAPFASPDYATGIYLAIFVFAIAAALVVRAPVPAEAVFIAASLSGLMAWLPARTVWLAMLAGVVALAALAPRTRRLRVVVVGVAAFVLAQAIAYPLQRIEDARIQHTLAGTSAPGAATADPGFVADDGLSAWTGGRIVRGHPAVGVLSRQVDRKSPLIDLESLKGLRPRKAYTIVFAVEPLRPVVELGRVGDTSGAGWGGAKFRTRPRVEWQRFRRRLVATSTTERLAFVIGPPWRAGARFDAVRVVPDFRTPPAQGSGRQTSQPTIVTAVRGTLDPHAAAAKTENLNMRWRLAIWRFQLAKWTHEPVLGVGFGRPTDFRWSVTGGVYDARTGHGPQDVTGPHNSFVNLLFRTGLLGALPLLALIVLAGARLVRWFRTRHAQLEDAAVIAIAAFFVFVAATATFSVALEGPYMGMFFWTALALLFVVPHVFEAEPAAPVAAPAFTTPWARRIERLTLPWPHAVIAAWTGFLLIGGSRAAKLGFPGPIYPNEAIFAVAIVGLILRSRSLLRVPPAPRWARWALVLFAAAFAVALLRGGHAYGREAVKDAGLGYFLLAPLIASAFVDRPRWRDDCMRVFLWASVITFPLVALSYWHIGSFAPLSLSIGFVLLFSVGPLLDDWLHGGLSWSERAYVVAVPVWMLWEVKSRSALGSLAVGLLVVLALNLRGSRRLVVVGSTVIALAVALLVLVLVAPRALDSIPPVKIAADTLNLSATTKGNNARWRLDYSGALLHRSVESAPAALVGVGLGRPSRFLWHQTPTVVEAYDFRGAPIPRNVIPNGDLTGPHDGFVEIAYRLGWPALLALLTLIVFAFLTGIRALRTVTDRDARWLRTLLGTAAAGIIVILTSDALRVPEAAVPFAVVIGLLAAYAPARVIRPATSPAERA